MAHGAYKREKGTRVPGDACWKWHRPSKRRVSAKKKISTHIPMGRASYARKKWSCYNGQKWRKKKMKLQEWWASQYRGKRKKERDLETKKHPPSDLCSGETRNVSYERKGPRGVIHSRTKSKKKVELQSTAPTKAAPEPD